MSVQKSGFGDYGARAKAYADGRLKYPNWIFERLMDKIAEVEKLAGDTSGEEGFLGASVLDVACGTGIGTRQLWDYQLLGFGVDQDPRMIKIALKTQVNMSGILSGFTAVPPYMVASVSDIPSEPRVHAITTFGGLYWFHKVPGSMGSIWNKLSRGGVFMAADEHHLYHERKYANIKRRYIEGEVPAPDKSFFPAKVLEHHGFNDIDTHEGVFLPLKDTATTDFYPLNPTALYLQKPLSGERPRANHNRCSRDVRAPSPE